MTKRIGRLNSVSPDDNEMVNDKRKNCFKEDENDSELAKMTETNLKCNESEGEGSNSHLVSQDKSEVKLKAVEVGVTVNNATTATASEENNLEDSYNKRSGYLLKDIFNKIFKSKRFNSDKLEQLYQRYFFRLNQKFINSLIVLIFLLLLVLLGLHFGKEGGQRKLFWLKGLFFPLIMIIYILILIVTNRSNTTQKHLRLSSYIMLLLSCCFLLVDFLLRPKVFITDGVWLAVFFIYLTYTLIPVRMPLAVSGGLAISVVHLLCCIKAWSDHDFTSIRMVSFAILLLSCLPQLIS